jgi:hypothetical protein
LITAKALKALSLAKLNKTTEANLEVDQLIAGPPLDKAGVAGWDESALAGFSAACKELNRFNDITTLYEKVHAADPKNEEVASHLFMGLVRQKEYKRQQLVAMSMYKTFGKSPYFFWAVTSVVMQARVARATGMGKLVRAHPSSLSLSLFPPPLSSSFSLNSQHEPLVAAVHQPPRTPASWLTCTLAHPTLGLRRTTHRPMSCSCLWRRR